MNIEIQWEFEMQWKILCAVRKILCSVLFLDFDALLYY